MNAHEIKELLSQRAEEVCRHLLPNGTKQGTKWLVGSVSGEEGKSLAIEISGRNVGKWVDAANPNEDKGQSLLALWCKVRGGSYEQAVAEAKEFVGGDKNESYKASAKPLAPPKVYQKPALKGVQGFKEGSPVLDYLVHERRLSEATIALYGVKETAKGTGIVFPYYEDGEIVKVMYLALERDKDGKKKTFSEKDGKPVLWGMNTVRPEASELIITEGQVDAMTWRQWGYDAVSVPNGTADDNWIELCFEWLERFERINLSFDMDEPGRKKVRPVAERLGLERCYDVILPRKDANDVLLWEPDFSPAAALENAAPIRPAQLRSIAEFADEAWDAANPSDTRMGFKLPWDIPLRLRPGDLTLLSGFSGHGKTTGLWNIVVDICHQGGKTFIGSFEIPAPQAVATITEIAAGGKLPSKAAHRSVIDQLHGIFLYDHVGSVKWPELLKVMEYARRKYGVDIFVVDSLLKCGIRGDDYDAQKAFTEALFDFSSRTGAHIILVAHSRKKEDEARVPDKQDIKGTGDIVDIACNIIVWWRNMAKQDAIDKIEEGSERDPHKVMEARNKHDAVISLQKQRFGGGRLKRNHRVWFHEFSGQFSDKECKAKVYIVPKGLP
jgi:twinkle protein